jgi:hypothetical protein
VRCKKLCDVVSGVGNVHKYCAAEFNLSVECKMDGTELPKLLQQLEVLVADVLFG